MPAGRARTRPKTEGRQRQGHGVGIAGRDEVGHRFVEADGTAQVTVKDAGPIAQVLLVKGQVEEVLVAQRCRVRGASTIAEHLLNGVAGNQMDEQKDQRNHQPNDGKSEGEAGEDLLHGLASTIYEGTGIREQGRDQESEIRDLLIARVLSLGQLQGTALPNGVCAFPPFPQKKAERMGHPTADGGTCISR